MLPGRGEGVAAALQMMNKALSHKTQVQDSGARLRCKTQVRNSKYARQEDMYAGMWKGYTLGKRKIQRMTGRIIKHEIWDCMPKVYGRF